VLGDVREPQPVRRGRGEQALHEVVVHGRTALTPGALLAVDHRDDPDLPAQRVDRVLAHDVPGVFQVVADQPVAELRIIGVDVMGGVDQVGLTPIGVGDRAGQPLVEALAREAQNPAGHRDGQTVSGKLLDQRVGHFGEISLAKYAAALRKISFSCSSSRVRLRSSRSSSDSLAVTPGRSPSSTSAAFNQRRKHDSVIPKSLATCAIGACP
jgi:hypothetical protein